MGWFKKLVSFVVDVHKSALQPVISTVNAVGGTHIDVDYKTSLGGFLGDLGTVGAEPIKNSKDSITGKDTNLKYNTSMGKDIGGIVEMGVDSGHTALKTYANTLTGGYASKVTNIFRDDEHKESAGNYHEASQERFDKGSFLAKVDSNVQKGAPIVGTLGASLLQSSDKDKNEGGGVVNVVESSTNTDMSAWGDMAAGVLGSVVTSLIDSTSNQNTQQSSVAAFTTPYVNQMGSAGLMSSAAQAAFGVNASSGSTTVSASSSSSWWDQNKGWAQPVLIGVSILFSIVLLLVALFRRKR